MDFDPAHAVFCDHYSSCTISSDGDCVAVAEPTEAPTNPPTDPPTTTKPPITVTFDSYPYNHGRWTPDDFCKNYGPSGASKTEYWCKKDEAGQYVFKHGEYQP